MKLNKTFILSCLLILFGLGLAYADVTATATVTTWSDLVNMGMQGWVGIAVALSPFFRLALKKFIMPWAVVKYPRACAMFPTVAGGLIWTVGGLLSGKSVPQMLLAGVMMGGSSHLFNEIWNTWFQQDSQGVKINPVLILGLAMLLSGNVMAGEIEVIPGFLSIPQASVDALYFYDVPLGQNCYGVSYTPFQIFRHREKETADGPKMYWASIDVGVSGYEGTTKPVFTAGPSYKLIDTSGSLLGYVAPELSNLSLNVSLGWDFNVQSQKLPDALVWGAGIKKAFAI